jgi:hypothetical protein
LKALEESLDEQMKVTLLTFVTQLMAIKSKFFFSNNCYNKLLKFIGDVHPKPNKLPKHMHHSKKLVKGFDMDYQKIDVYQNNCMLFCKDQKVKGFDMDYQKIDVYQNNCMLFCKDQKEENKCLQCGK